jgi:hypothetical protein
MGATCLFFNDGTGWARYFSTLTCSDEFGCWRDLTGIPRGTLYLLTELFDPEMCSPVTTVTEEPLTLEPLDYQYIFVVDETLAYGILRSGLLTYFDGESWGPYPPDPTPHTPSVVWADRSSLFIAGREGVIMSHEDGEWRIQDTGVLDDISELWGSGANDVWAGTYSGRLLHWDGTAWEEKEWPSLAEGCDGPGSIEGMWGSGGVLYFHTHHDLVLWDGAAFVNILNYRCGEPYQDINGLWGNAPDEVFVSVYDQTSPREGCDDLILLWWDGHEFHWF